MTIILLKNNLILKILLVAWLTIEYQCDEWDYKLTHDLLRGYDSAIRPSTHHSVTLNVTFGLALAQLIDVVNKIFDFLNFFI